MPSPFPALVAAEKSLLRGVVWSGPGTTGVLEFLAPLAVDGWPEGGLDLRGTCLQQHPNKSVMLQLEASTPGERIRDVLVRLEWRPLNQPHRNPRSPGHALSRVIVWGTHVHSFELNWLPDDDCMRPGNLPYAVEIIPDFADFEELVDFAKELFRINGIDEIEKPLWVGR